MKNCLKFVETRKRLCVRLIASITELAVEVVKDALFRVIQKIMVTKMVWNKQLKQIIDFYYECEVEAKALAILNDGHKQSTEHQKFMSVFETYLDATKRSMIREQKEMDYHMFVQRYVKGANLNQVSYEYDAMDTSDVSRRASNCAKVFLASITQFYDQNYDGKRPWEKSTQNKQKHDD